jgi:hypothetical protein
MRRDNPKRWLAALQHGDDLVDNLIALGISEPAEVLAEHVFRQPHHAVGEHDSVVGLGGIGGGPGNGYQSRSRRPAR